MEKKNINEVIAELSVEQLAGMIDHTFLKPFGDASPIENFVRKPVSISLRWWPSIRQKWKTV